MAMKDEKVWSKCVDVTLLCRLLSESRSGFYKHSPLVLDDGFKSSAVLPYCRYLRDNLPTAGTEVLQTLCIEYFSEKFWVSQDWLYKVTWSQ